MQESIETLRTELEERLRFETLLAETSARFVNLPADRIASEIESAQRRICELLDLDRSSLWQVPEREDGALLLTHIHRPPGGPPLPERPNAREFFPWVARLLWEPDFLNFNNFVRADPEGRVTVFLSV